MFSDVTGSVSYPELERRIIEFWRQRDIFRKTLDRESALGDYVFYEGPPTANGKPGVHHVISRAYKDLFPRFRTMQGYRVERKGGWDTHGLPVEIAIEKRLGFTSKSQIEEYGIERFNELCRSYVFENIRDWNEMTERIGFWLDLENAYVTYDNSYIESTWWVMKQLFDRGLLVEDYKTTWHSPSSNTTLASHEVSLGYKEDVEDPSVFPKFPFEAAALRDRGVETGPDDKAYFLAWTTTPWTLAANSALAVKPGATYALVRGPATSRQRNTQHLYVLAHDRVSATFEGLDHEVLATFPAQKLEGISYEPILRGRGDTSSGALGHRVVLDDFVTLDDGTGVVHLAPAYGDLEQGRTHNLPTLFSVSLTGQVMPEVAPTDWTGGDGPYAGMWFKDADSKITSDLLDRELMFLAGTIRHAYPFNWRDGTPLMNVAKKSWYIRTSVLKDKLLETNERINWVPDHIKHGRFGRWLENNVDWALSRERYWGAPMPVWESEDGERICVGSVAELSELAGRDLTGLELHRPFVDDVVFERDGKSFRRVPYTVDVWFESGAMPYAQWGYLGPEATPEAHEKVRRFFPADYICEAVDQTRGWFYSLHALATLLTYDPSRGDSGIDAGPLSDIEPDTSAYRNVISLGHIVDENGEKMSKSKGNVVDPWTVLDAQGADALRWYLYSSSPPGTTKRFSQPLVEETVRDFLNTLWSTYYFFVLYANLDQPDLASAPPVEDRPPIDRWLEARLAALVTEVTEALESYDPTTASRHIRDFVVLDLSNWYVRRNRRRFWKSEDDRDKASAYASLHRALMTVAKLAAPMAPFVSEEIYRNLVTSQDPDAPESVHLASWPRAEEYVTNVQLLRDMQALVRVVELGRSARAASAVKTRQPLPEVLVRVRSQEELEGLRRLEDELLEELNVKRARYLDVTDEFVDYQVKPNLPLVGKRLGKLIPALRKALESMDGRAIARNVREGAITTIELDGQRFEFEPEAFLLDARSPEGFAAVEERGYLAALDTRLTPELVREGLARDVVRLVQNSRKNAGLEVSDRIEVGLSADGELASAIDDHREVIATEVLAVRMLTQPLDGDAHVETGEVDGMELGISLRRSR